jgi:alpha-1,6-mannosyltransferase
MVVVEFLKSYRIPLLLAIVSTIFYGSVAYDLERNDVIKLTILFTSLFFLGYKLIQTSGSNFWFLAGLGVLFRLVFIVAIPNLSQDFYRFLWDGRILIQGINPYLFTPDYLLNDPTALLKISIPQAEELYRGMGELNASNFSNYPPINQFFFAIAAVFAGKSIAGSVIILRLTMILADLGILYFGKKILEKLSLPPSNIFWYFLNPFVIIELTGNLHFEGVMLFFVLWSLYLLHKGKWFWAAILLAISIGVKLIPLLFLPLFYQFFVQKKKLKAGLWNFTRFGFVVLCAAILLFAPFLSAEFLQNFLSTINLWFQNFEFNASIYNLVKWIGFEFFDTNLIVPYGKISPFLVIAAILILAFFRKNRNSKQLITAMLFGISVYFLLATTVHPWYICTPLILSVFTKYKFPIIWSLVVMLSYSAYQAEVFSENLWLVTLEYTVLLGFAVWELFLQKTTLQKPIVHF